MAPEVQTSQYAHELSLALRTVHRASLLTKNVLRALHNDVSAETKADDSPVTIADFAAQCLIISALHAVFPTDTFIGEESANALRENEALCSEVWKLVEAAPSVDAGKEDALTRPKNVKEMLDTIDLGQGDQTAKGRVWVLDPVDGTATFMKGQQYAVCLCLLIDGVQQVGVIGCPNLLLQSTTISSIHEDLVDTEGYGVILSAIRGHGTQVRTIRADSLDSPQDVPRRKQQKEFSALKFVESESGSTTLLQSEHRAVATSFDASWPGTILWSQQMKYVSLTLGASDVLLRIPANKARFTCTWDHAGGQLLFQEVGGIIQDLDGGDVNFGQGRKLLGERNFGMVACLPWALEPVREVVNRRRSALDT